MSNAPSNLDDTHACAPTGVATAITGGPGQGLAWIGLLGLGAPDGLTQTAPALLAALFDRRTTLEERDALADAIAMSPLLPTSLLVDQLASHVDEDRAVAARALAAPRHLDAVPALVRNLGDVGAAANVRGAAAHALGSIGDASVIAVVAAAIEDDDADVRRAALVALRTLDPTRRSVPAFLLGCADDAPDVRSAALAALLLVGGPAACAAARAALADPVPPVRALAVVVLTRHGGLADAARVGQLATDPDGRVRRAAREALAVLAA